MQTYHLTFGRYPDWNDEERDTYCAHIAAASEGEAISKAQGIVKTEQAVWAELTNTPSYIHPDDCIAVWRPKGAK